MGITEEEETKVEQKKEDIETLKNVSDILQSINTAPDFRESLKKKMVKEKEESLVSKLIFPIDRMEQDEDGVSVVRIKAFNYEDVKAAVLEFNKFLDETTNDEFGHNETPNYEEVLTYVLKHIDDIFGDFEE